MKYLKILLIAVLFTACGPKLGIIKEKYSILNTYSDISSDSISIYKVLIMKNQYIITRFNTNMYYSIGDTIDIRNL